MANILIAGCGDVGTALALRLLADGHQVTGIRRHPPQTSCALQYLALDMTQPNSLLQLTQPYDYLFFLPTPDQHTESGYRTVFVDAFTHLSQRLQQLAAQLNTPLPTIFYISSTGVYGQNQGEWVDETSTTAPTRFSGRVLLEGEALATKLGGTIIRFSGIYGPGRERLINKARELKPIAATPPSYTNRIHRDDCAGVLQFLLQLSEQQHSLAPVYLGTDSDPAPQHQVLDFLAQAQGLAPLQTVAAAADATQNKRCRNQRLLDAGYQFIYPSYRQGYQAVIDNMAKG
ncbi:SDR family NAD(P)-dependent oxidoreductase [Corallincola holothuriorum]|uniref:SDR family NAD(P)-dependent oxidoreductase n=1 Tax=Corallincola holothuriorum TaxID=2282215 RepID=A0A368NLS4_9GAMM|nr:SDR family oxidoreductase [Corallincola holothuriorum]RCU51060.1 SDR family NAD(P)-dependent oxidoreductase [Corallincola holothuriorum]